MAWNQSGNIRGASGVPGASGASGLQGASGVPGASGPVGATGASGGTGGTGGPGTTTWADISDKPGAILNYKGTWNASTNTPSLTDSTGSGGDVYRVSVGGSRNLGSGTISWEVGDYAIWSPVTSSYEKADTTDAVSSVAGRTGDVTLTSADLGASGTPSASTFLRGDNTWATGPIGATGASGGTGATGGTGAAGSNYSRVIQTITAPTTLGASGSTDYVTFLNVVGDLDFSSVKLLLHADGTNNSTTVVDSSSSNRTVTARGSAKISTAQAKFGSASLFFNGADAVTVPINSDFDQNITAWTVEMWFYRTSTAGSAIELYASNAVNNFLQLGISGSKLTIEDAGVGIALSGPTTITNNVWHHAAMVKNGSTVTLYLNGTSEGTLTRSGVAASGGTTVSVGGGYDANNYYFTGYIDEVRVSRIARYTGNFTVPSAAFGDVAGTAGTPTLPAASGALGRYSFRNISGSSITIGASGSQAINGATGGLALANGSSTELMSDGSGWYTF